MRVLHVIGQRPEKTGSGIYLQAIAREIKNRGFSNYLIAGVPAGTDPDLENIPTAHCRYVYFESESLPFPVTGMSDVMPYKSSLFKELKKERLTGYKRAFSEALQKAVIEFRPDVIHTHHLLVLTALTRKLFPALPIVTTCHGTDLRQFNNCRHLRAFAKKYCQRLDSIIALSNDQKTDIMKLYDIPGDRIYAIGGGYDEKIFNRIPKRINSRVHILYAGKFNRSKGVFWLLRSLAEIKEYDWHLHMAGSGKGPEFEECMTLAKKLGEKVTVHGYVNHHQLATIMKKVHIQILPSFFEGLPLVLFEGLASGCRIITTNLAGFEEIFGAVKREIVDLIELPPLETIDRPHKKDERWLEVELSQKILAMISRVKKSPNFTDAYAEKIASDYTWKRIFDRISTVYHHTIQSKT